MADILTVVPARGGSKRIPRKNIRPILGKPMIAWPLEELKKFSHVGSLMVSTDDLEIKELVEQYDVSVPFMRPEELSNDYAGTTEVIQHALDWHETNVGKVDFVLIVYPTAVFLRAEDIDNAYKMLLEDSGTNIVVSAAEFPFPIQRAVYLTDQGYVRMFQPEHYTARSQDLQVAYQDAGQFYFCRAEAVRQNTPLFCDQSKLVVLPRDRVVDIDTEEDLAIAEKLLKLSQSE